LAIEIYRPERQDDSESVRASERRESREIGMGMGMG